MPIRAVIFFVSFFLLYSCKRGVKDVENALPENKKFFDLEKNQIVTLEDLKNYIVTYSIEKHNVGVGFFDKATIDNTDLLREIVHYVNYKNKAEGRRPKKERYNELGYMFKEEGVGENCGFMSTTLFDIYQSLGFTIKRYDVIDGNLDGFLKYRDSHVFVEVYIPSLKKYIVQDPTINNSVFSCENLERLSFEEIRKGIYRDNKAPCFLDNNVSKYMSPSGKLTLRQKIGILEDYYTGSILSVKKFNDLEEVQFKLHDMNIVANENKRVVDLNELKTLCATCKLDKNRFVENAIFQRFMKCLNTKVLVHGVLTSSFNKKEKGFLVQFTNEKGLNVLYDPIYDFYIGKSYFTYAYWDLNNRGFLRERDLKYMIPLKFYSYRTNEVFEF